MYVRAVLITSIHIKYGNNKWIMPFPVLLVQFKTLEQNDAYKGSHRQNHKCMYRWSRTDISWHTTDFDLSFFVFNFNN